MFLVHSSLTKSCNNTAYFIKSAILASALYWLKAKQLCCREQISDTWWCEIRQWNRPTHLTTVRFDKQAYKISDIRLWTGRIRYHDLGGMSTESGNRSTQRKQCCLVYHKSNPGRRSGKPATDRLRYCTGQVGKGQCWKEIASYKFRSVSSVQWPIAMHESAV
jgi:hypothetical protein